MAKNEKKVQTRILNDLRSFGKYCEVFKIMKTSDAGEPDIFFTTRLTGAVFIETKRHKGKLQKIQKEKIAKLNSCGVKAFVCRSISGTEWPLTEQWLEIKKALNLTKDNVIRAHDME